MNILILKMYIELPIQRTVNCLFYKHFRLVTLSLALCCFTINISFANESALAVICPDDITIECGDDITAGNTGQPTSDIDNNLQLDFTDSFSGTCPEILTRTWTIEETTGGDGECNMTTLVTYSGDCDDPADCLLPTFQSASLSNVTSICPTDDLDNASCNDDIICIASIHNDWDFKMTAVEDFQIDNIVADFWYPTDGSNAGGIGNVESCPTSYDAIIEFYIDGILQEQVPVNVPENQIIAITAALSSPLTVSTGSILSIIIDGQPVSGECDLFELAGLEVNGCSDSSEGSSNATTSTCTQIITIEDTTPPTATAPADITVCDLPAQGMITASDDCAGNNLDMQVNDQTIGDVVRRTWSVTDPCGNMTVVVQNITIDCSGENPCDTCDDVPTIEQPASLITAECDANQIGLQAWLDSNGDAIASNNCTDAPITWTNDFDGSMTPICGNSGSTTVTFTATDACGNTAQTVGKYTSEDTTPPTATAPADITVCDLPEGTITTNDSCNGNNLDIQMEDITSGDIVRRSWTITDPCGNTTTVSQNITIDCSGGNPCTMCDNFPTIEQEASSISEECDINQNGFQAWLDSNGGAIATNNCSDDPVTWTNDFDGNMNTICGNSISITVTFTATDICGSAVQTVGTYTTEDTTPPTATAPADITICDVPAQGMIPASDICAGNDLDIQMEEVTSGDIVRRTWTVTDPCGNATSVSQNITIDCSGGNMCDNCGAAPVITTEAVDVNVECSNTSNRNFADLQDWLDNNGGAVATDDCNELLWTNDFDEETITIDCGISFNTTVIFTVSDNCGNAVSTMATFTVEDNTPPTATAPVDITVCDIPDPTMISTRDNCSENSPSFQMTEERNGDILTRSWTVTDECGNMTVVSQNITIDCSGNDPCDNCNEAPVISNPADDMVVECDPNINNEEFLIWLNNNGGAEAMDDCNQVTWTNDFDTTEENIGCGFTLDITITFTASDECGNSATTTATFTIEDSNNPFITTETENLVVECDGNGNLAEYQAFLDNNAGAIATDDCSEVTWTNSVISDETGCPTTQKITVEFVATDACGNTNTRIASFTTEDTTPPTATAPADITICDEVEEIPAQGLIPGDDICAGDNLDIQVGDQMNGDIITRVWTVTDPCGNATQVTQNITIDCSGQDPCDNCSDAPVIPDPADDLIVECDGNGNQAELQNWLDRNGGAQATDDCDQLTWTNDFAGSLSNDCGATGGIMVTFTVADECGNATSTSASFTIEDSNNPFITSEPENLVVECDGNGNLAQYQAFLDSNAGGVATDNCSEVTWTNSVISDESGCPTTQKITVEFVATDACGNTNTRIASFTTEDTTPPTATAPEDITICDQVEEIPAQGLIPGDDICAGDNLDIQVEDNVGDDLIERIWTITDPCGNESIVIQNIFLDCSDLDPCDNCSEAPVIPNPADNLVVECDGNGNQVEFRNWLDNNGGAEATDDCDQLIWTNDFTGSISDDCGATGTITVTFTVADECGNATSTTASFTIEDSNNPFITSEPINQTVECDGNGNVNEFQAFLDNQAGAIAEDQCSEIVWTSTVLSDENGCPDTRRVIVEFVVTDDCGNTNSRTAAFDTEDTTPPVIQAPEDITICTPPNPLDIVANDVCAGDNLDIQVNDVTNGSVIIRTWTITDPCGNAAMASQTITVDCNRTSLDPGIICLEAECGELGSGWSVLSEPSASNSEYIVLEEDNFFDQPGDGDEANIATYLFVVTEPEDYVIWGLTTAPSEDNDSFWIMMDDGEWILWNAAATSNAFAWNKVTDDENGQNPFVMFLDAGVHTLKVAFRESNAGLDKICLQHDQDPDPIGFGQFAENCENPLTRVEQLERLMVEKIPGRKVDLTWAFHEIEQPSTYTIEHSKDDDLYNPIIECQPIDKGEIEVYYERDNVPKIGLNYYRLRIDFDNKPSEYIYSDPVSFSDEGITAFPNPAKDVLYVDLSEFMDVESQVKVFTMHGVELISVDVDADHEPVILLDLSDYNNGMYTIWVKSKGFRAISQKIVISNLY